MSIFEEFPALASGALPIDPHDLAEAFRLMSRVYSGEDPYRPPVLQIPVTGEEGEQENLPIEDTPLNRVLLALKEWYHEEPLEKYVSLCWRLFSLSRLVREGVLEPWVYNDPADDTLHISGSVIRAAAELPLESIHGFDRKVFLSVVSQFNRG